MARASTPKAPFADTSVVGYHGRPMHPSDGTSAAPGRVGDSADWGGLAQAPGTPPRHHPAGGYGGATRPTHGGAHARGPAGRHGTPGGAPPRSPAWLREHVTALRSCASTIAGAEDQLHDHPAIRPNDTRALRVDQLTPCHPDVQWHSADLNVGWPSPTGYYWIPEACDHTSCDASGGGPCRHATTVALAADLTRTLAVAILGTVLDGEGVASSLAMQYGIDRQWIHTLDAEVILHLLRHANRERATGVLAGAAKVVNQMFLQWLQDSPRMRGQDTERPFWFARANSNHSDALLHRADWAASGNTILQNTPPGPSHAQLIIAGRDGHLNLRPPTMQTPSAVAQQAQLDHALTHRGHTPLGAANATAYFEAQDLTAAPTNHRALRARDGHTPVQRRLRIRKERLSGVAVLPQPCLLCGGLEETPVHMHVGCAHSRLLRPHYRQAVQEAARQLSSRDKALWVASWRSAGAQWTEFFCSGLAPEAAEAQLCAIACNDLPGGTSVDDFLQHMLQLGNFVWEVSNHQLEQLLREPLSAAAGVHLWLTAADGDCPPLRSAAAGALWPPFAW